MISSDHAAPAVANPDTTSGTNSATRKQHAEIRKANKPLMEKRRRARINKSLNELKSILVESTERNPSGHTKWEKADILEMTVQYLHCVRHQGKASKADPLAVGQFIAGYSECIRQIQKFAISRNDSLSPLPNADFASEVREKLTGHLLSYLKSFSHDATRTLQSSCTTTRCPSPIAIASLTDNFGLGSGEPVSRSRRSTLSSFASPSPSHDSMDSDDSHHRFSIFSSEDVSRRDLNNNPKLLPHDSGMSSERESGASQAVWRPW